MDRRREPQRSCVGCGATAGRSAFLRIALGPGGAVIADRHRRLPGRGAYVHPTSACVDRAIRRGSLARSLRSGIGPEEARKLRDVVEGVQGNG
ncbi:MAG: YlxR family protein [Actinobacteria bacterium]|nr:MAG: YlxR family protein [Actinomycetota bacterium]TMK18583.1 MAG: YlxR family protein [Actinomycetota bacterium]TMK91455.1 MAG: YlxR family protein [Actinomycetota bacterium]